MTTQVDEHGLTQFIGGDVRSRQQVLYTEGAIIASRPPAVEVRAVFFFFSSHLLGVYLSSAPTDPFLHYY